MRKRRRTKYDNAFGASVSQQLAGARMGQPDLASATGYSTSYVNQVITGRKKPSAKWVDLAANAMGLSDKERQRLHHEAAKRHGFKLDLTKE